MSEVSKEYLGISVLALTQAVTIYHQFLPPLTDIRKMSNDDRAGILDVRIGELASTALTLGIGAILSMMTGRREPMMISVVASVGLVGIYEFVLRSEP
jgi:hypothetical protein